MKYIVTLIQTFAFLIANLKMGNNISFWQMKYRSRDLKVH